MSEFFSLPTYDLTITPNDFGTIPMEAMLQIATEYETASTGFLQLHVFSALAEAYAINENAHTRVNDRVLNLAPEEVTPQTLVGIFREEVTGGAHFLLFNTLNFDAVYAELQRRVEEHDWTNGMPIKQ